MKKEIKDEVESALAEVGEIVPWFDKDFKAWLYSNPLYPVECEGKSAIEVIKKYPLYLQVYLEHRLRERGRVKKITKNKKE